MRVLVTGGSGYLGSAAVPALVARGHEVVTIGRHRGLDALVCDLTDPQAVHRAVRAAGEIDVVVHLAARAHNFRGLSLDELLAANTATTRHLAETLRSLGRTESTRFVHASSVAVYEVLDPVQKLTAAQAPYAASKLQSEHVLIAEPFQSLCVLRFAPIYDPTNLEDVAKRVFLPGTRLKLRLSPPPFHSLCARDRAVQAIVDAVESDATTGRQLTNVHDPLPLSQHELASWFPGYALTMPTSLFLSAAKAAATCGTAGGKAASLIRKFAESSRYPEPSWDATLAWRNPMPSNPSFAVVSTKKG